ncbi:MAG: hypothetical protein NTX43_02375 [Bacteroidetes bacterium]|nr:hypothetical protein [Bacteroidota bacterium]
MKEIRIIGLLISDRIKEAGRVQELLTEYACLIKSRLGFHEVSEDVCSRIGVILLQLVGDPEEFERFEEKLKEIGGVEVQHMIFKT